MKNVIKILIGIIIFIVLVVALVFGFIKLKIYMINKEASDTVKDFYEAIENKPKDEITENDENIVIEETVVDMR